MTIDLKAIRAAAEFTKNNTSSSFSVIETDALSALLDRLEAAEAEVLEQARLLGIGGEKELALMARLEAAEKDAARYRWLRRMPFSFGHGSLQVFRDDRCDSGNYNKQVWGDELDAAADYCLEKLK